MSLVKYATILVFSDPYSSTFYAVRVLKVALSYNIIILINLYFIKIMVMLNGFSVKYSFWYIKNYFKNETSRTIIYY